MQRLFVFGNCLLLPPEQIQRDFIGILKTHAPSPETLLIRLDNENRRHAAAGIINAGYTLVIYPAVRIAGLLIWAFKFLQQNT